VLVDGTMGGPAFKIVGRLHCSLGPRISCSADYLCICCKQKAYLYYRL